MQLILIGNSSHLNKVEALNLQNSNFNRKNKEVHLLRFYLRPLEISPKTSTNIVLNPLTPIPSTSSNLPSKIFTAGDNSQIACLSPP